MSRESVRRIGDLAETVLVDATWAQWSVLTTTATAAVKEHVWTIVDPEALVLASYAVVHRERRLTDILNAWGEGAAYLMSMQRMLTLAKPYPEAVTKRLRDFARSALAGGDRRWQRLADADASETSARKKELGKLRLIEGPALTLRLRAGFGVSAKADVLSLLLGLGGVARDLKAIAEATAYTPRAIRTAAEEMTLAGFIHEIEGRPSAFYADTRSWAQLLQTHRANGAQSTPFPRWRYWSAIFLFLAGVIDWAETSERKKSTDYVVTSRAHDLFESHSRLLKQAQVDLPAAIPGGTDLQGFEQLIQSIDAWVKDALYASKL
jgi:hypothetical protein